MERIHKQLETMPLPGLKALRESRMVTRMELAQKAGISRMTIERLERGLPSRMDVIKKVLKALDLPVSPDSLKALGQD